MLDHIPRQRSFRSQGRLNQINNHPFLFSVILLGVGIPSLIMAS